MDKTFNKYKHKVKLAFRLRFKPQVHFVEPGIFFKRNI